MKRNTIGFSGRLDGVHKGKQVGLVNLNTKQAIWYDPHAESFRDWLDRNQQWGADDAFQALRYIIAN